MRRANAWNVIFIAWNVGSSYFFDILGNFDDILGNSDDKHLLLFYNNTCKVSWADLGRLEVGSLCHLC